MMMQDVYLGFPAMVGLHGGKSSNTILTDDSAARRKVIKIFPNFLQGNGDERVVDIQISVNEWLGKRSVSSMGDNDRCR